jgi:hypothetical protein
MGKSKADLEIEDNKKYGRKSNLVLAVDIL